MALIWRAFEIKPGSAGSPRPAGTAVLRGRLAESACSPLSHEAAALRSDSTNGLIDEWHGWCRGAFLLWVCLALSLAFITCGARMPNWKSAGPAMPFRTLEPLAAARSLESTLQIAGDIDEISFYPEIASNARGDSVAVWEQFDGERYRIWGNSRPAGQAWGLAVLLETSSSGHAYSPQLALNAYGSATAIWVQADPGGGTRSVWSNRLEVATGWGEPSRIDGSPGGPASSPRVTIDERGHVTATWEQSTGSQRLLRTGRYRPGSGWDSPTPAGLDRLDTTGR